MRVAIFPTHVCGLQIMACREFDLLHPSACGAQNTCGKPSRVWMGGFPGVTSLGLKIHGEEIAG